MPDAGEMTVLARSLAIDTEVGSNLRGGMSGGGWLYALPRLGYRRAVCVGTPPDGTLTAMARSADEILVIEPSARRRRRTERLAARRGWTGLRTVARDESTGVAAPDLVVLTGRRRGAAALTTAALVDDLAIDGVAVLLGDPPAVDPTGLMSGATRHVRTRLALTPAWGEVRSAVPAGDRTMRAAIHDLGLEGTILQHPRLARIERAARARLPLPWHRLGRQATVLLPRTEESAAVPAYIRDIAATGGRDLADWRWGVAARGDYDSQKVLVLLAPAGDAAPTGAVKVTRSSAHAARLENEAAALESLATVPEGRLRAPVPWFSGRHAGRAVLGESFVDAVPFAQRATWGPTCRQLDDALGWLTTLGAATRREVPPAIVAATLLALLDRFVATYRPTAAEVAALRSRFEALSSIDGPLPTVLQHGDPGIWNLVVDREGRTVFLDWESAEPDGLPLWDLLYCFRSYAAAASRRAGNRDRVDAAAGVLLDDTPLSERLVAAVADYRVACGLPVEAVDALVFGCWVHRSLKEATRLPATRLADGNYVRLVRRMLDRPDAPTLVRLSGGAA